MNHKGLFRPKYKDRDGTVKESKIWWLNYSCKGCQKHPFGRGIHRESAETESVTEARRKLESRRGAIADGKGVFEKADRVRINELFQLVVNDYRNNGLRTLPDVEMRLKKHVLPFFAGRKAHSILTADIEAYKTKRLEEKAENSKKAKPATINRELSRSFSARFLWEWNRI